MTATVEDHFFEHYNFTVDKGQSLLRLDKYLMGKIQNVTRNKIQNAVKAGSVLVNNEVVKSNYKVKPNEVISIIFPHPPENRELIAENIPINIVYEDDSLLIVNKVSGMVVHPAYANFTGTLVNALLYHFNNLPTSQNGEIRPGLVHRIDKDTSGLLVVAKDEDSMAFLAQQFFEHSIERRYVALVWGYLKEDEGTIDAPLSRSFKDRRVMQVNFDYEYSKRAVTHYKVLERFEHVTLIECRLETGRTHQIRAHMKYIGHPIFNDATYGGEKIISGNHFSKYKQFINNCFGTIQRQALHALSLGFIHPKTKTRTYFESDLPDDFASVLEKWRKYNTQIS